jgi:hypothetical protein
LQNPLQFLRWLLQSQPCKHQFFVFSNYAPLQSHILLTYTTNRTPIGCWSDSDYRALASNYTSTPTMTAEQCAKYCIGYNIFGTEDGASPSYPFSCIHFHIV